MLWLSFVIIYFDSKDELNLYRTGKGSIGVIEKNHLDGEENYFFKGHFSANGSQWPFSSHIGRVDSCSYPVNTKVLIYYKESYPAEYFVADEIRLSYRGMTILFWIPTTLFFVFVVVHWKQFYAKFKRT